MMRVASRRTAYRLKRCSPSLVRNALRHFITDTFPFRCVTLRATSFLVNKTPAPHREVTGKQARFAGLNSPTIDACDLPAEYRVRMGDCNGAATASEVFRMGTLVVPALSGGRRYEGTVGGWGGEEGGSTWRYRWCPLNK